MSTGFHCAFPLQLTSSLPTYCIIPRLAAMLDRSSGHAEIIGLTGRGCRLKDKARPQQMTARATLLNGRPTAGPATTHAGTQGARVGS